MKDKEVELVEAQQKTDKLLKEISARTTKTEKKKSEVATVKDALELDAKQVEAGRDEAQRDLAQAKPALEEAEAAIDSIKAKDIQVLKQLRTPPEIIKIVFDGVLLLMRMPLEQVKTTTLKKGTLFIQDSYSHATKLMADINFLKNLRQFDSDTINDETVELLSPYLELEEFTPENAKKSSSAAAGLATWVGAMSRYYEISKDVKPKIEKLQIAEDRLRIARNKLQDKEDELATVEAELAKVQATFDDALRKKNKMQDEADSIKRKLESANNLISALSGERDRWTEQSGHFKDLITRLVGEVALACGFISYCGPFNSEFRSLMLQRFYQDCLKRNIPVKKFDGNESFDVTKFLVDESEIGEWNIQGLPTDPHSVQNGIMVTRSDKWPLLIDPQGQGLAWIKKREENNNPMICQISDRNFKTQLTDAISLGRPMIIENVSDYLDPMLDPILEKAIFTVGKLKQIVIQGRAYDWSDDFRLYLTSKMSNPHYSPETFAKTTIIDFAVTMSGLEQQLLGVVIQQERADLEERREKLLKDVNENEKEIKGLEDDLLQQLASSEKNLLEDTKLIETLANTKAKASEVKEKLSNAKQTEKTINLAREAYNPVAIRGSVLYFVIVEMSLVNSMYQTSLKQFLRIFDTSIQKSETDPDPEKRINNIIEYLTFYVYLHVVRGLFERHKLLFLLLIATKVLLRDGHVSLAAFNALLKGGAAKDMNSITIPKWDWIPDSAWLNVIALSETVDKFKHLPDLIKKNEKLWKFFYDQEAPESAKVPDLEAELTDFDRLLLVRSLREDRSMLAATNFISKSLGPHYVKAVPLNLTETLEESTERTPVIFLLSPGSDPTTMIENLAKRKKKELHSKSMGHNQEAAAKEILVNGFNSGGWVLLQNCHLGLDFLKEVEDMLLTDEIHPEFRLWVTSEPTDKFPIGLLQMSIKLTNEPPEGLKAGLQRSFQWVNQDILDASRRVEWKPLVYSLCFAHSIVQERRKFGSLGWNIPYEFNQSDLAASFQFLQNHFMAIGDEAKKGPSVSWDTVHYMICEVQYGGRITDDFDRRLFNTYGHLWLSDNILKNNFSFAPNYNIIMGEDIATYKKEIENIPSLDKPEVFGLHPNADITYRTNQSVETLKTIMDVQPKQAAGKGGETREDTVSRMAAQWLNDLPDDFKMDEVREQIVALGGLGKPLNIFLFQEVERLQHVLEVTRTTLEDLQLAIAGTIVMSADLQNILNSLYDAAVPSMWLKVSWTSPNIGLWFSEFVQRYDQLSKWLVNNRPKTFWLTGFFNPQGFLTAVRQEVARARKWALDNVVVKTEVLTKDKDDIRDGPSEGVYIHGLFLEGAGWDVKNSRLEDSQPKVLHVPLPVLHVTGVDSTKTEKKAAKYICPVYKKPRRTDQHYIFDVELNTNEAPEKWILGGVALLCSTT